LIIYNYVNACQLVPVISTIAIEIADSIPDNDELTLVALSFTQLGDALDTIATKREIREAKNK